MRTIALFRVLAAAAAAIFAAMILHVINDDGGLFLAQSYAS
jgi:hypothetical protein